MNKSESKKSDVNGSATSVLSSQQQSFQQQPATNTSVVQSIGSATGSGDSKDQVQLTSTHESGPTMLGQMISEAKSPSNSITPLVTMCTSNTNTPAITPVDVPSSSSEEPLIDTSVGEDTDKTIPLTPIAQCVAATTVTVIEPTNIVSGDGITATQEATTDTCVNTSSSESSSESATSDETEPTLATLDSSSSTTTAATIPQSEQKEEQESDVTQQMEASANPPQNEAANIVIEEERRTDVVLPMKVGLLLILESN